MSEESKEAQPLPELPPVEDLERPEVPPVSDLQTGSAFIGPPRPEWEPRGKYDADAMCQVWGRVQRRQAGYSGPIMPLGAKSQLCDAKAIANYLESPVRIVEPGPDDQVAREVEITPGFWDVHQSLWLRYVIDMGLSPSSEAEVLAFVERLHQRWPHGFTPEPERRIKPRVEELREIQEDVERSQRRRPMHRRPGAR